MASRVQQGSQLAVASVSRASNLLLHVALPFYPPPLEITVTQTYQAQIYVTLRPSVLDPAGTATQSGLKHMGYDNVTDVRIGKYIQVTLSAESDDQAKDQLDRICDQLLANPVIENYRFDLEPMSTSLNINS